MVWALYEPPSFPLNRGESKGKEHGKLNGNCCIYIYIYICICRVVGILGVISIV